MLCGVDNIRQAPTLQGSVCCSTAGHATPSALGSCTIDMLRDCNPPPHEAEHADQSDQSEVIQSIAARHTSSTHQHTCYPPRSHQQDIRQLLESQSWVSVRAGQSVAVSGLSTVRARCWVHGPTLLLPHAPNGDHSDTRHSSAKAGVGEEGIACLGEQSKRNARTHARSPRGASTARRARTRAPCILHDIAGRWAHE